MPKSNRPAATQKKPAAPKPAAEPSPIAAAADTKPTRTPRLIPRVIVRLTDDKTDIDFARLPADDKNQLSAVLARPGALEQFGLAAPAPGATTSDDDDEISTADALGILDAAVAEFLKRRHGLSDEQARVLVMPNAMLARGGKVADRLLEKHFPNVGKTWGPEVDGIVWLFTAYKMKMAAIAELVKRPAEVLRPEFRPGDTASTLQH